MIGTVRKLGLGIATVATLGSAYSATAQNAAQIKTLANLGVRWSANAQTAAVVNGVPAVQVPLDKPAAVAYDAAGNFYVADENNNLVRKVDTAGVLTTYAGTGEQDSYGDGGQATQAALDHPQGVAVDSAGNLLISDTGNQRIRRVTAAGVISTVAGTGTAGFSGDGSTATQAALARPVSIAADPSGNVFFADSNNHRVREIVQATGNIVTVAGNGEQGYSGDGAAATSARLDTPEGIAVDAAGNVYLGDTRNNRVRRVSNGVITTVAGTGATAFTGDGGAATAATFASPRGVAVTSTGIVYIADANNQRVRQIAADGTVSTVVGNGDQGGNKNNGIATQISLDTPRSVAAGPLGTFAVADTGDGLVRSIAPNGSIVTVAGLGTQPTTPLVLSVSSQALVYGQGSLTATATSTTAVSGSFVFYDFGAVIGTVPVANNSATLALGGLLKVGPHSLSASYAGDASNPSAVTSVTAVTVTPAAITASVNTTTVQYGQGIPALTGTLNGVLAQDAQAVSLTLSTTATSTSAPGVYPITGVLSGSAAGNYTLAQPVGSITITKAATITTLASSTTNSLLNAPITLTATVASTTSGTPTGTVTFLDGSTTLGSAQPLANGVAQITVSTLSAGPHTITVAYSGDANFNASASSSSATQVSDFTFTIASSGSGNTQTVIPGQSVTYNFTATSAGGPFPYPITLSATGLPSGATATFNPSTISLTTGSAGFTMTVQTSTTTALQRIEKAAPVLALLLLPASAAFRRRARGVRSLMMLALAVLSFGAMLGVTGCGSSSGFFGTPQRNYTINVVATASNGQGSTLQRTATVTLTVQ